MIALFSGEGIRFWNPGLTNGLESVLMRLV